MWWKIIMTNTYLYYIIPIIAEAFPKCKQIIDNSRMRAIEHKLLGKNAHHHIKIIFHVQYPINFIVFTDIYSP